MPPRLHIAAPERKALRSCCRAILIAAGRNQARKLCQRVAGIDRRGSRLLAFGMGFGLTALLLKTQTDERSEFFACTPA
ncbi:hypothetical protein CTYAZ2_32860 [Comamonas testosteroni]|nr:hypothetical protein CTYAZ2_32860 [Comamonas testosteroni]